MRACLLLVPALVLTACATPREQCLSQASRDAKINASLIAQTKTNVERGFGLRIEERVRDVKRLCRGETESGEAVVTRCEDVRVTRVQVPVALDLDAERAKLASLIKERDRLSRRAAAAAKECRLLYPE